MRNSEWIQAGFAAILAIAAWIAPLPMRRRRAIAVLAACVFVALALAYLADRILSPLQSSILHDWLPVPLTLIPYWQTGQFFTGPNPKIQSWLLESDRRILGLASRTRIHFNRFARLSMEWAYMLCYPMVPLGLATLYFAGLRRDSNLYWFLVLVPTYLCYAVTPFVPALPPRSLVQNPAASRSNKSRVFNLWILKHGSIQAISFPSAHVAAALAVSFVLLQELPVAGFVCLALTLWISLATIVGGYHYAIDVLLGALVTLLVYGAWCAHLIPSTLVTAPAMAFVSPL